MANLQQKCKLCKKRIMTHNNTVNCSSCNTRWHAKCLPIYSANDIQYAKNPLNNWTCPHCLRELFPFNDIANDTDFLQAVTNPISNIIDIETLESMIYDPFDANNNDEEGFLSDIDPDKNFLGDIRGTAISKCKYYYNIEHMENALEYTKNSSLSMLHLNIRSLPKNIDSLMATIRTTSIAFDILGFTETWLKPANADCHGIQGYTHEFSTRDDRPGGGVSIFVNEKWNYRERPDLNVSSDDIEMLWIEIDKDSSKTKTNLIVGTIYRRPGSDIHDFNTKLQLILTSIRQEQK
jgi:hypothetical protein